MNEFPAHPTNYSRLTRMPTLIVLHSTEGGTAHSVAAMFASPLKPARSAHYVLDQIAAMRCVPDANIAWHCGHQGNVRGIGIEICGRAADSVDVWLPRLPPVAALTARLCQQYAIPARFIDAAALRSGASGITTHAEVSQAWHETTHTDPGVNFPIGRFLGLVADAA